LTITRLKIWAKPVNCINRVKGLTSGATIPISSDVTIKVNIELLSIGNELLSGTIANSNAQWISSKITQAGGLVRRITTIGDSISEISAAAKESIKRNPDWLIISGGLGPTYDDKTLQGLSTALGQELALDPEALEMLKKSYALHKQRLVSSDKRLNETRLKMARIPTGSTPIQNPVGSAPAVYIEAKIGVGRDAGRESGGRGSGRTTRKTRIVCLPGVPKEMEAVFSRNILTQIKKSIGKYYFVESMFETIGVSEAMLAPTLSRLVDSYPSDELYLKTHPKGYKTNVSRNQRIRSRPKLDIQLVSKGKDKLQVEARYATVLKALKEEVHGLFGEISLLT
jgi:molybdenum cofactor synthesis domain-containing protein